MPLSNANHGTIFNIFLKKYGTRPMCWSVPAIGSAAGSSDGAKWDNSGLLALPTRESLPFTDVYVVVARGPHVAADTIPAGMLTAVDARALGGNGGQNDSV